MQCVCEKTKCPSCCDGESKLVLHFVKNSNTIRVNIIRYILAFVKQPYTEKSYSEEKWDEIKQCLFF